MTPKTIGTTGILGCGWLGKALAIKLLKQNIKVKGTTTSIEKLKDLEALGIATYQVEFIDGKATGALHEFLNDLETLIISVPSNYKNGGNSLYNGLKLILNDGNLGHIQKILYVSSTGVFEDGEDCNYDEDSTPNARSKKGQYLIQLEKLVASVNFKNEVSVLRCGGLIKNSGRHPVYYLAGRTGIANPDAPVNLIEQNDVVELIYAILSQKKLNSVYHGVYPWHPTRKDYYTKKAIELALQPPDFTATHKSIGKKISSEKTSKNLKFTFRSRI